VSPQENERIATLTAGAIKSTTEAAIKAIWDAVEAAEAKSREMRDAAERFVAELEQTTNTLANDVTAHVTACQGTIDTFQAHHLKILNVDTPTLEPRIRADTDDFGKLQTSSPSLVDGRR
jgi:vacuolar-type H+-ATPase subunit D/Vma8